MKTASAKAKGRNLCKMLREIVLSWTHLSEKDVVVTSSGVNGVDLQLSEEARKQFPYAVECKNQESLNLYNAWEQCKTNAIKEKLTALLVVKRNNKDILAILSIHDLMELIYAVKNKKTQE